MHAVQHHKSLSLDLLLPDGFSSAPAEQPGGAAGEGSARAMRRKAGTRTPTQDLEAGERQGLQLQLVVDGRPAHARVTPTGIEWSPVAQQPRSTAAVAPATLAVESVPFCEMLSAVCGEAQVGGPLPCLRARRHCVEVLTFRRGRRRRCEWAPRRLVLEAADEEVLQDLAAALTHGIEAAAAGRPKSLLVILNPNSGYRQGGRVWRRIAAPVLAAAGVKCSVRETRHGGHATEVVSGLSLEQLQGIDGVVCVGGDGVFHEAMNGLLQARGAATTAGDAPLAEALSGLRLAHIPAGSTDAVACTLHGTRAAFAAAMHVALGDSTPLDLLRVDTAQGVRFASCIAAFGFLADVTSGAEAWRFLGPVRYDLVGAAKLAVSRAYPARVRYLEGEVGRALSKHAHETCGAACTVCRTASFLHAQRSQRQLSTALSGASAASSGAAGDGQQASPSARRGRPGGSSGSLSSGGGGASQPQTPAAGSASAGEAWDAGSPAFVQPATQAAERHEGEEWREIEGEFCSIMLLVMPCRSDKTRAGMARFGHLSDGRLKLVLVRKCNPAQYLRFLVSMSRRGCAPGQLSYVEVLDAVAVQVEPLTGHGRRQSCWNLDGELVAGADMRLAAEMHHGLIRVFSRGVEM